MGKGRVVFGDQNGSIFLFQSTVVDFMNSSGPPFHAILPGVFDRTGGDRIGNGVHFGPCLGILGKRGPIRARIEVVVKSKKR